MNRARTWSLVLFSSLAVLMMAACGGGSEDSAPAPSAAPAAPPAAVGNATVSGTVTLASGEDMDITIQMNADPVCAGLHEGDVQSETMVIDDEGNLANVFIYVKSGLSGSFPAPSQAAIISQKGCLYTPHVLGLQVGQTLKVVNQDPTLHNVHASPKENAEFNQAQPFQGMELERTFDSTEVMIPFKCDVHPWMSAYMAVLDHPFFAVSATDGSFSIEGLPAGTYTLEAWHEVLGTQSAEATVEADGSIEVDFAFEAGA